MPRCSALLRHVRGGCGVYGKALLRHHRQTIRHGVGHCMSASGCHFLPPLPGRAFRRLSGQQIACSETGPSPSSIGSSADNSPCCCQPGQSTDHPDSHSPSPNRGKARMLANGRKQRCPDLRNLDLIYLDTGTASIAKCCASAIQTARGCGEVRQSDPPSCTRNSQTSHSSGPLQERDARRHTGSDRAIERRRLSGFPPVLGRANRHTGGQPYQSIEGF